MERRALRTRPPMRFGCFLIEQQLWAVSRTASGYPHHPQFGVLTALPSHRAKTSSAPKAVSTASGYPLETASALAPTGMQPTVLQLQTFGEPDHHMILWEPAARQ